MLYAINHTDAIVYNSILVACSSTGDWELTRYILHIMKRDGISRDAYTYTAAITALDKANRVDLIRSLVTDMIADNITNNVVPYNAAIYALPVSDGNRILRKMIALGVMPNTNTYASLIGSLGKESNHEKIIQITDEMRNKHIPLNALIYKSVILAFEKTQNYERAWLYFLEMKREGYSPSATVYNSIIACRGYMVGYNAARAVYEEMGEAGVSRSTVTYNNLITACRKEGWYREAVDILRNMSTYTTDDTSITPTFDLTDTHTTPGNSLDGYTSLPIVKPDTVSYSACISVCIDSKQWSLALELLQEMEEKDISRNVITYNTVIEALTNAGETVRSELVYQSALRSGVYDHWHPVYPSPDTPAADNHQREYYMDFHRFPAAVARAAIMHVLGEIVAEVIEMPSRLVIITGVGNHIPTSSRSASRPPVASVDDDDQRQPHDADYLISEQPPRGILSKDLQLFLGQLGLNASYDSHDKQISASAKAQVKKLKLLSNFSTYLTIALSCLYRSLIRVGSC